MQFPIRNLVRWIVLILSLAGLTWFGFAGLRSARESQQSRHIIVNAQALFKALDFFYQDYDRYPQVLEFQNSAIMASYVSIWPLMEFPSELCPQTYIYKRPSPQEFEIFFCLPSGISGFTAGWNKLTSRQGGL